MPLQKCKFSAFILSGSIQESMEADMQMCWSLFCLVSSKSIIGLLCTYKAIFKSYKNGCMSKMTLPKSVWLLHSQWQRGCHAVHAVWEHRKHPNLLKSSLDRKFYGKLLASVKKETLLRKCLVHALHKKQISEVFWHYREKKVVNWINLPYFSCFFINSFTQRKYINTKVKYFRLKSTCYQINFQCKC